MRITLREFLLLTAAVCTGLGGYQLGYDRGERQGQLYGFAQAEDRYQVMLSSYAEDVNVWHEIGHLWREYPNMRIIGHEPFADEHAWQGYVQYHAQRNGWKDAAVFQRLANQELVYAKRNKDQPWEIPPKHQ